MNPTENSCPGSDRSIVIFGAGKIGRSFIGQLFGSAGYEITFIDVNPQLVNLLNEKGSYKIIFKSETENEIVIQNLSAVAASDTKKVEQVVSRADILSVAVGKNFLVNVIPSIAAGIKRRFQTSERPLDIIIAENMRSAAGFVKKELLKWLPPGFPLDTSVGLIETSIGKMVPIMTASDLEKDPLLIHAEPYNTLILDRKGFRCQVPDVPELAPKDNISAWVDRKAFIHNLGHATVAYFGFFRHPEAVYVHEVLGDTIVSGFTRMTMLQAADILMEMYPHEFSPSDLVCHIDDLLARFRNKALQDTLFRIGHDLTRKLRFDDRFAGIISIAVKKQMPYEILLEAMSYGFFFKGKNETGNIYDADLDFLSRISENFEKTSFEFLGLSVDSDFPLEELREKYFQKLLSVRTE
jgi:mannitol-1-phosphate 5-dehydrogenase